MCSGDKKQTAKSSELEAVLFDLVNKGSKQVIKVIITKHIRKLVLKMSLKAMHQRCIHWIVAGMWVMFVFAYRFTLLKKNAPSCYLEATLCLNLKAKKFNP